MVASVAAAGVVAFSSAAVAAVGVSTEQLKNSITGQTNLDNFVGNNTNGQDVAIPPSQGDLTGMLEDLRGDFSEQSLTVREGTIQGGSLRLANSVQQLSDAIERENAGLPGGEVKSLSRLSSAFDRSAAALRQAPAGRVQEAVTVNDEVARGLYGLEMGVQRMQQLEQAGESLEDHAGDALDSGVVQGKLADVAGKVEGMLR